MSTHRNIDRICLAVIAAALVITVLFMNGENLGITVLHDGDTEANSDSQYFTDNDLDGSWSTGGATTAVLDGDCGSVSGSGAYMLGGDLIITSAGRYVVSGTLDDGSLRVDAADNAKVWIMLSGVSLSCSDDAAIYVAGADKVFLTLADGSENTVESGAEYSAEALADKHDGAIFSHDDLTINGSGSLTVTAGYKHGIAANDDLFITGGSITVSAPTDAIHAGDRLCMREAVLTLEAGDDGMSVGSENGELYIESGSIGISAEDDGIHTVGGITLLAGALDIDAGDDGIHSDSSISLADGVVLSISRCYEGIEAPAIDITGGDITVYSTDDGINACGGSSAGGFGGAGDFGGADNFGGDGSDRFGGNMPGGKTDGGDVSDSAALSASAVTTDSAESGGSSDTLAPTDSGDVRSSAGHNGPPDISDASETSDIVGADGSSETAETADDALPYVHISGGRIVIINSEGSDADGIDSNGDILIDGGELYISLSGSGNNTALDYGSENGGVCRIDGGILVACGSSSMLEEVDSSSAQVSVTYVTASLTEDGCTVSLADSDGTTLLTHEVPLGFTAVTVSCPGLSVGDSCTLAIGDSSELLTLSETAGSYGSGGTGTGGFGGSPGGGFDARSRSDFDPSGESGGGSDGRPTPPDASSFPNGSDSSDPSETSESSEMPELSDFPNSSGFSDKSGSVTPPERPDGADSGMPTMPDSDGNDGMPESEGGSGDMPTPSDGSTESDNTENADADGAETGTTDGGFSTEAALLIGSIVLLAVGLAIAFFYRKRS